MKMRGRKPVPTALTILRGNPGKRPLNDREPAPQAKAPPCPRHLNKPARAEWKRMAKRLIKNRLLTEIDGTALALYCDAYARWVDAKAEVEASGYVVKTALGNPIQNPYLAIVNKAHEQVSKMLVEFGMTPSSRSRAVVSKPTTGDQQGDRFLGNKTGS